MVAADLEKVAPDKTERYLPTQKDIESDVGDMGVCSFCRWLSLWRLQLHKHRQVWDRSALINYSRGFGSEQGFVGSAAEAGLHRLQGSRDTDAVSVNTERPHGALLNTFSLPDTV